MENGFKAAVSLSFLPAYSSNNSNCSFEVCKIKIRVRGWEGC
jgi:hypothetical protein